MTKKNITITTLLLLSLSFFLALLRAVAALQPTSVWIPQFLGSSGSANCVLASTSLKYAFLMQTPKTGTLDSVGFLVNTVTQKPVNGLKVSFQSVSSTTGDPSGVIDQYTVVASSSLAASTWVDVGAAGYMGSGGGGSGTRRSVNQGDYFFAVIEFNNFVANDSVTLNCPQAWGGGSANMVQYTYVDKYATSTWAKQSAMTTDSMS